MSPFPFVQCIPTFLNRQISYQFIWTIYELMIALITITIKKKKRVNEILNKRHPFEKREG